MRCSDEVASPKGVLDLVKAPDARERYLSWAELLRRVHGVEVLNCPCGGTRKIIAFVDDPKVLPELLARLGLPTRGATPREGTRPAAKGVLRSAAYSTLMASTRSLLTTSVRLDAPEKGA